ncbi:NHL repeat-containing protein [Bdellovibrio reynosensis]|uniref:NHL repeat-containing protein n=1 Tax=Bdellovibrio reynosensis TaxID=2835041 RepID=A0ABY4CBF7_9BACT|nr:NHL repeat-containing protein [Bdellovibrio reynosensis]UOF02277.1 NHL repeat-containing protein [Bdellovibrio reynosensis]
MNFIFRMTLAIFFSIFSAGCTMDAELLKGVSDQLSESPDDPTPTPDPVLKNTFPIGGAKHYYSFPLSMTFTDDGKLFVTSYQDMAMGVQQYDIATGDFVFGFGTYGNTSNNQFEAPERLVISPAGKILVIERFQHKIKVFDMDGTYLSSIGSEGVGQGQFKEPTDVVFDKDGRMYVSERQNCRIQVFNADGSHNRFIGSGPGALVGQLNAPTGIDVDDNLNVYVLDAANKRVQIFKANNTITTFGTPGNSPGQFNLPYKVRVNSEGDIFVNERIRGELIKFSPTGILIGYYTGNPANPFNDPYDFQFDENDNVYVASLMGGNIQILDKNGNFIKAFEKESPLGGIMGLFIDSTNNIYSTQGFAPGSPQYIFKFNSSGQQVGRFSQSGTNPGQLQFAIASVVDAQGNIYTSDMLANKVWKYDKDGNYIKFIGTGVAGTSNGDFGSVAGLCFREGFLYATDTLNGNVQKFDTDGNFVSVIGATAGPGKLSSPVACYVDLQHNLYVIDQAGKIYKYDEDEDYVFDFAHPPSYGIYVDATGNIFATDLMGSRVIKYDSGGNMLTSFGTVGRLLGEMNGPSGIAADSDGNLYVAEAFGKRIQKFSPLGIPLTE